LANATGPDGQGSPWFDGSNDYNNIYSTALRDDVDGDEGTFSIWAKVNSASVWTDGTTRNSHYFYVDGDNHTYIRRQTNDNRVRFAHKANGTIKVVDVNGLSSTDWIHLAITWSNSDDAIKAYIDGVQQGSTQTGLDSWAGQLSSQNTNIGCASKTGPDAVWHGWLAHGALWKTPLSSTQIVSLAVA
jgi:hypothetical protein